MDHSFKDLQLFIERSDLTDTEKQSLLRTLLAADKQQKILEFKLQRTEQVKRTTLILLEETIEELEQKRRTVEETNTALQLSLEELKATQQQLIQSEKMASLGELTAGIAHEIQNPLNFVNNFSQVSKELLDEMKAALDIGDQDEAKEIADDVIRNLEKINHHGKRADAIVKGMLEHSRKSDGKKEPTDINALVDEYLRLSYHGLRAKDKSFNANMELNLDKDIGQISLIAPDIGRVLLNLFNNAFYAVHERQSQQQPGYQPTVTVDTQLVRPASGQGSVLITVTDNGNGISTDIIDKIFQPFFTTKPTGQGTGLGLSLSYDIVKAHGGDIKAENNDGARFFIRLPL